MGTKKCTKCGEVKSLSEFGKIKSGTFKGKQRYRLSSQCYGCKKDHELFKTCTICNCKLPKTKEHFQTRKDKSGTKIYVFFRHACRKCLNAKVAKYKREKYSKDIVKGRIESRRKYWKDPIRSRENQRRWKEKNPNNSIERDRRRIKNLGSSYIALMIGMPVNECPQELIESKRLVIQIKRELGATNFNKRSTR